MDLFNGSYNRKIQKACASAGLRWDKIKVTFVPADKQNPNPKGKQQAKKTPDPVREVTLVTATIPQLNPVQTEEDSGNPP